MFPARGQLQEAEDHIRETDVQDHETEDPDREIEDRDRENEGEGLIPEKGDALDQGTDNDIVLLSRKEVHHRM